MPKAYMLNRYSSQVSIVFKYIQMDHNLCLQLFLPGKNKPGGRILYLVIFCSLSSHRNSGVF